MTLQKQTYEQNASGFARRTESCQVTSVHMKGKDAQKYIADKLLTRLNNFADDLRINPRGNTSELVDIFKSLDNAAGNALPWTNELVATILEIARLTNNETKFIVARIILKSLQTPKRCFIVAHHLEDVTKVATVCALDSKKINIQTGISMLQILFEVDPEFSEKVLKLGGLDPIISICASKDYEVLEACSAALFKVVLHGGRECETHLTRIDNLTKWFLPLINIYDNKAIKYFACLTVIYLNTVCEKYHEFFRSGIFDDIVTWISDEKTHNYLLNNTSLDSIDKKKDLTKLMKLLTQRCKIAQTFGSFLFCCEIYNNIQKIRKIFYEIGAVKALKRIAFISNPTARKFAISALQKLSENSPKVAPDDLQDWTTDHIQEWLGFVDLADHGDFVAGINGQNLFKIKERELKVKFCMFEADKRKMFFEELQLLKVMRKFSNPLVQTFSISDMLSTKDKRHSMSSKAILESVKEDQSVPAIENVAKSNPETMPKVDITSCIDESPQRRMKKKFDVFISYRRSNGSELASLLKMHLSLKNYKVFLDVQSLKSGRFGENLIKSVQQSKNFLLILSPNAFDRCCEAKETQDWVRIEIETALKYNCNIIPIANDFDRSVFDRKNFPENMKKIQDLNWIIWHHDAQV